MTLPAGSAAGNLTPLTFNIPAGATTFELPAGLTPGSSAFNIQLPQFPTSQTQLITDFIFTIPAGQIDGINFDINFELDQLLDGSLVLTLPAGAAGNAQALTFTVPAGANSFVIPAGSIGNATDITIGIPELPGQETTTTIIFTIPAGQIGNADDIDFNLEVLADGSLVLTLPAGTAGNAQDLVFNLAAGATSFVLPAGAVGNATDFTIQLPEIPG